MVWGCGVKMVATRSLNQGRATLMPSLAAVCYPTVSKNHCLSILHILFVSGFGWVSLPVWIDNTSSAAFKYSDPLIHALLCWYLEANWWWISAPSDIKNAFLHVSCPWCKPLVWQPSSGHAHAAQRDNWTTLTACHCLTMSYSITMLQQRCQLYNENIPILRILFK